MPGNSADTSAILALPYIQPSQAQKHVTHNEAISTLDVLVQLSVAGFGATTPPVDPVPGEVHALGAGPTGVWAGQDNKLATWRDGVWVFITPLAGWRAWGVSEAELRVWDGTAWGLPPVETDNLAGVGINTTADATNRLSVSAPATLLSHEGAGHQLKINKAGDTDTASLLFQSGWTGHAEMGLSGGTDFAIKVSDDGVSWTDAMIFDGASGGASGAAVQSGATDATPGKLMKTGAFGLGATAGVILTDMDDTSVAAGMYSYIPAVSGTMPPGATSFGFVLVHRQAATGISQTLFNSNGSGVYTRTATSGTWSPWRGFAIFDAAGKLNADLHVSGSGDQEVIIESTNNLDARLKLVRTTSGSFELVNEVGTLKIRRGASGATDTYPAYAISATRHHWYDPADGTEAMRLLAGGDLVIGASSGTSRLSVVDSADKTLIYSNNTNAAFSKTNFSANNVRAASVDYNFLSAYSGNWGDLEFRLSGNGNGTCDGSWTGGGADYAEYFEWADGNPMAEDRRGIAVVLVGDQIRQAKKGENPIGVISGNPSVIGDAAPFRWKGKYQRDDFGSAITEDYEVVSWTETVTKTETVTQQATQAQEYTETAVVVSDGTAMKTSVTKTRDVALFDEYPLTDKDGNDLGTHREPRMIEVDREVTKEVEHSYATDEVPQGLGVPKDAVRVTQTRRKLNPDYTPGSDYTPREDRPEWDTVGLMGKLRLRKGQLTDARWVRMRKISDDIEEWLVR